MHLSLQNCCCFAGRKAFLARNVLPVLMLCIIPFLGQAQQVNHLVEPEVEDSLIVSDAKFDIQQAVNQPGGYDMKAVHNIRCQKADNYIAFYYDEAKENRAYPVDSFKAQAIVSVYYWDEENDKHIRSGDTLTIDYQRGPGRQHHPEEVLRFEGGHHVIVEVEEMNMIYGQADSLKLEATIDVEADRYYEFDPQNDVPAINTKPVINSNDKIEVNWGTVASAKRYDLEWTYVNNLRLSGSQMGTVPPQALGYDFDFNSTRVTTDQTQYQISNVFEPGYLLFRVRAVSSDCDGEQRYIGEWSGNFDAAGMVDDVTSQYNNYFLQISTSESHENELNWQYQANYAEEGKKKEVVEYYDGTKRNRQKVTNLSTENLSIVKETIYDHQGRGAVEVLPAPAEDNIIQYYKDFNRADGSGNAYNRDHFDESRFGGNPKVAAPMDSASGAAEYYSGNYNESRIDSFVPRAQGYPFKQEEKTPDQTGRMARKSGVGPDHYLGSDHGTRRWYGTPTQPELDRLFGNEVGAFDHYKKTIEKDPNGQITVKYLDPEGEVIATGMAGERPPNQPDMAQLPGNNGSDSMEANLSSANERKSRSINSYKGILVSSAGTHEFSYQLSPPEFQDTLCNIGPVCYDMLYDLRFSVTGAGDSVFLEKEIDNPYPANRSCDNISYALDTSLYLDVGSYTINKELSLNEAAVDSYTTDYVENYCLEKNLDTFVNREKELLNYEGCYECDTCTSQPTDCKVKYEMLRADMTPKGQYMDYARDTTGMTVDTFPLSVLNPNNSLNGHWQDNSIVYLDAQGNPDSVFVDGEKVIPQNLDSVEQFIDHWKPSWADALVQFHPEYCIYDAVCPGHEAVYEFSRDMRYTESYDSARDQNFINPLNNDPFFMQGNLGGQYKQAMSDSMSNYAGSGKTMKEMALVMLYAPEGDQQAINDMLQNRTFGGDPAMADEEWARFRALYLSEREHFLNQVREDKRCVSKNDPLYDGKQWRYTSVKDELGMDPDKPNEAKERGLDSVEANLGDRCNLTCSQTADDWMESLSGCAFGQSPGLDSAEAYDSLQNALIEVCKTGCDAQNPWGSKTTPPGETSAYGHVSFADAIQDILGISTFSTACNPQVIQHPRDYGHTYLEAPFKGDSCTCEKLGELDNVGGSGGLTNAGQDLESFLSTLIDNDTLSDGFRLHPDQPPYASDYLSHLEPALFGGSPECKEKHYYTVNIDSENVYHGVFRRFPYDTAQFTMQFTNDPSLQYSGVTELIKLEPNPGDSVGCGTTTSKFKATVLVNGDTAVLEGDAGVPVGGVTVEATPALISEIENEYGVTMDAHTLTRLLKACMCDDAPSMEMLTDTIPKALGCDRCADCDEINALHNDFQDQFASYNGSDSTHYETMLATYMNNQLNNNLYYEDYQGFLKRCDTLQDPSGEALCFSSAVPGGGAIDAVGCEEYLDSVANYRARKKFREYKDSIRKQFRKALIDTAMTAGDSENYTMDYMLREYHYTLYYYDQAGNLVKTIAPKGVNPIENETRLDSVQDRREGNISKNIYPYHEMERFYQYNTLDEVVWQSTPDGGETEFWYDKLGRSVASQEARQTGDERYNYTRYDALGRTVETGEVAPDTALSFVLAFDYDAFLDWLANGWKSDIRKTYYDSVWNGDVDTAFAPDSQTYLRGRVATRLQRDHQGADYSFATHYSYDPHGNVKTLVREYEPFDWMGYDPYKRIDYEYDLISGKVNKVIYQPGDVDQFIHRYEYDADNRITNVHTSKYGVIWDEDAGYDYYKHGPLARKEIGDLEVQGVDYAYTIHGWLKGVNAASMSEERDMGRDGDIAWAGNPNKHFARDAFAFQLHYYDGDYQASGGRSDFLARKGSGAYANELGNLYNGNITGMVTNTSKYEALGYTYYYDQLNRLAEMDAFGSLDVASNKFTGTQPDDGYEVSLSYDANGNILSLKRKGEGDFGSRPLNMDDMEYHYKAGTNQLTHVEDDISSGNYENDLNNQGIGNYGYDASGNMVTDGAEGIDTILWNAYGKVEEVRRADTSVKPDLAFRYGPDNRRIAKVAKHDSLHRDYTYYARDAEGNIMATYGRKQERSYSKIQEGLSQKDVLDSLKKVVGEASYRNFVASHFGAQNSFMDELNETLVSGGDYPGFIDEYSPLDEACEQFNVWTHVMQSKPDSQWVKLYFDSFPARLINEYQTGEEILRVYNDDTAFLWMVNNDYPGVIEDMFYEVYPEDHLNQDPDNPCQWLSSGFDTCAVNHLMDTTVEKRTELMHEGVLAAAAVIHQEGWKAFRDTIAASPRSLGILWFRMWTSPGPCEMMEHINNNFREELEAALFDYGSKADLLDSLNSFNSPAFFNVLLDHFEPRFITAVTQNYTTNDLANEEIRNSIPDEDYQALMTLIGNDKAYTTEHLYKQEQMLYGSERLGVFRSGDTLMTAEGHLEQDTNVVDYSNSAEKLLDTTKAVMANEDYTELLKYYFLLDTAFRNDVITKLANAYNRDTLMVPRYDTLGFICQNSDLTDYVNLNGYSQFLNNYIVHQPDTVVYYLKANNDPRFLYRDYFYYSSVVDSLEANEPSVIDSLYSMAVSGDPCGTDMSCKVDSVKAMSGIDFGNYMYFFFEEEGDNTIINMQSPGAYDPMRYVIDQSLEFSLEAVYMLNLVQESLGVCRTWKDQLNWSNALVRNLLKGYDNTEALYSFLYAEDYEQFMEIAIAHRGEIVEEELIQHFTTSELKPHIKNFTSTEEYETILDRLQIEETFIALNKTDSMYAQPDSQFFKRTRGARQYELKNHLGNVLATVTDRKIPQDNDPDQFVDYYEADVASASDYYPFGMQMPGRSYPEPNHDTAVHDTVIYELLAHYQSSSGDSQLENREAIANYLNDTLNTAEETEVWMSALEAKRISRDSLYLDGTASNVDFGKKPQYEVGTNDFTIEAWFYYPSGSGANNHSILSNVHFNGSNNTFNGYALFLSLANDQLVLQCGDASGSWSNSHSKVYSQLPSPDQWHHVVAVRDGNDANDWKLYVDGQQQPVTVGANGLDDGDLTAGTNEELQIGSKRNGQPNGSRFFEGSLKEVRFYERRLDGSEVAANYNAGCIGGPANTSDLLLHAPLDEGTGSVIEDHSPYGEIGELVNSAYTWERGLGDKRCLNGTMELSTGDNEGYRFGFQGEEKLNELYGEGNSYGFKYRISDSRVGRFLSLDPKAKEYPYQSSYVFSENRLLDGVELEGLEFQSMHSSMYQAKYLGDFPVAYKDDYVKMESSYGVSAVEGNVPSDYAPSAPEGKVSAYGRDIRSDIGQITTPPSAKQPGGTLPGDQHRTQRDKQRRSKGGGIMMALDALNFAAGLDKKLAGIEESRDRFAFYRATRTVDKHLNDGSQVLSGDNWSQEYENQVRPSLINYVNDGTVPEVKSEGTEEEINRSKEYREQIIEAGNKIIEREENIDYQDDNPHKPDD